MKVNLTIIFLLFACISCRNPEKTPELRDPIYLDMQERLGKFEKELKHVSDERSKIQDALSKANPQSGEYKQLWKDHYNNERAIFVTEQKVVYYKMALESRAKQARLQYLEAFKKEKESEWPNPDEFARYKSRTDNNDYLKVND